MKTLVSQTQSRQAQSKKAIQTKSTDVLEFRELMDQLMSKTMEFTVHDKVRDEQLLEKYMSSQVRQRSHCSHGHAFVVPKGSSGESGARNI
jgi:hypothetical protein